MNAGLRSLVLCLTCCIAGPALAPACALAEGSSALGGTGGSPLESPVVVPEALPLLGGEAVSDVEEARRVSPEVSVAREESQTKYEGLNAGEAARLAEQVFPEVVDRPGGGLPQLPEGESVVGYLSDHAARVVLPEGKRGVVESLEPIAVEASSGRLVPMDLGLVEAGGGFVPRATVVGVQVPKQLEDGVSLMGTGVSLTPVDAAGGLVGGAEGRVDGSAVFYGGVGVGSDVDEVVKPLVDGFSEDAILRSQDSPSSLRYRVGLPEGASLVEASDGEGRVNVVDGGSVIASIAEPFAYDASGTAVPVSMVVSGSVLTVTVDHGGGGFEYPIYVDPSVVSDKELDLEPGNWVFHTSNSEGFYGCPKSGQKLSSMRDTNQKNCNQGKGQPYSAGQVGYFEYPTQGESQIYGFISTFEEENTAPKASVVNRVDLREFGGEIERGSGEGGYAEVTEPATKGPSSHSEVKACRNSECGAVTMGPKEEGNSAIFEQEAIDSESEEYLWYGELKRATVDIEQEKVPTASFDTSDSTIEGQPNALLSGRWWNGKTSADVGLDARDWGIGIDKEGLSSPSKSGWGFAFQKESRNGCEGVQCNECYEPPCQGKVSGNGKPLSYALGSAEGGELPEGEDTVEGKVEDAVGLTATAKATLKVDRAAPHSITLSGLPSTHEITDGQHVALKASATDGSEGIRSSGVASIVLEVDGQAVGSAQGSCSPGPCTGNGEWTLSGENYASGEHTLTVIATDNAGNVASEEYHVIIRHAGGVAVGPGSVNPVTGELSLTASDVSLGVPGGSLMVNRSYRSRPLAQGTEGPLGPQWVLSLGAEQSLSRVSGGMVLTGGSGGQIVFEGKGEGEFNAPMGDSSMVLLEKAKEGKTIFTLNEDGSVTTFEQPSGSNGSVWMPSSSEGPNGTSTTLYKFKVANGVIEPTEELAPVSVGVSCGKEISELKEGCRALKFEYDEGETKAEGEKASQWGEFAGHLSKVRYIAWSASKTKNEPVVAEYAYDKKGRLRAEWNPQITSSLLKTTYGYDVEGHVTAVSTPGHEPWLLEQGTIPSDSSPGRLLAVAVPSATTALGNGEAPTTEEALTLSSSTPKVGVKISVNLTSEKTPGKWGANPLAFIYQWEDCNSSGNECTPIPGAVNQAYYPVAADEGHKLVAEVVALNATGASAASSAATSTVASGTPNTPLPEPPYVGSDSVWTLEYQVPISGSSAPYEMSAGETAKWGQSDDPSEAMAIFPPDKVMGWPAKEYKRETVYYLDGKDRTVNTAAPTGGISTAEYNQYNDVVQTLSPDNRAAAVKESCKSETECKSAELAKLLNTKSIYEEKGSEPGTELLSTLGPQHTVKLAVGKEGKKNEEVLARAHTSYDYNESAPSEGGPYRLVTKTVEGAETVSKEEFDKRTTETSYGGQGGVGWKLRRPTSVTINAGGLDLVHTTLYEPTTGAVTETRMPGASGGTPSYSLSFGKEGGGNGEFKFPDDIAVDGSGHIWVTDTLNNRVQELTSGHQYVRQIGGSNGTKEGEFKELSGIAVNVAGDVYAVDSGNNRVQEFSPEGKFIRMFGYGVSNGKAEAEVCTSSCQAGIAGSGAGQFNGPMGIAIDSSNNVWLVDTGNNRVEEFNEEGKYLKLFGSEGKEENQFNHPVGITLSGGNLYVVDEGNDRVEEFSTSGSDSELGHFGSLGSGNGQFSYPTWIATDPASGDLYVNDYLHDRIEKFNPSGTFLTKFGESGEGQLDLAKGLAVTSSGNVDIVERDHEDIEEWLVPQRPTGNEGAYDTKTIYYTAEVNSEYTECGKQPAMAGLLCETRPAAQPGTSGLPELPVTKYEDNFWNEPTTTTETVGTTKRTKTNTYDEAGRLKTTAISSTVGETLPTVTYEYNKESGALEKQSTGSGKIITSVDNKLGQLESYTDAAENKTTYEYDIDGRIKKINDGKGIETYTYSEATGLPTELINEYLTTKLAFTATYDPEGNQLTETYPNGITATYTYNQVGKPTSLVYKKTTHCTEEEKEKCKWFKDAVTLSIHGQWIEQTSTLSHQTYTYDNAGRLTEVQNTPAGQGCTTHIYTYDEDTNRTSLTIREPNSKDECSSEGGKTQTHTYDTADRLTDPGIVYNPFGDITTLPAKDAEETGEHELTSTYYTDNQLASQKQNKQTISYILDPAGRALETDSTGEPTNSNIVNHYAGPDNTPAWTSNTVSGEWRRNITGINGNLVAIQNNGETPELQLANLHGDIIAKAYLSETATELAGKADTSEYGVPTVSAPAKYSWLGAIQLPTELPSGVTNMGARSYVPQVGRFLQPDPVPGGSANAYAYTYGDPVNTSDPTGAYTAKASKAIATTISRESETTAATIALQRTLAETAARTEAENAALKAQWAAETAAGPQYTGEEEEWEEWYEEEGSYEEVAYHHGESGKEEHHIESGVLYQPLGGEEGAGEGTTPFGSAMPLCKAGVEGPCTRTVEGNGKKHDERCASGLASRGSCKQYWRHHRTGGPTAKDGACTFVGAVGGVFGDFPGAIAAGGACVLLWP